jgi:hypothetical protein
MFPLWWKASAGVETCRGFSFVPIRTFRTLRYHLIMRQGVMVPSYVGNRIQGGRGIVVRLRCAWKLRIALSLDNDHARVMDIAKRFLKMAKKRLRTASRSRITSRHALPRRS